MISAVIFDSGRYSFSSTPEPLWKVALIEAFKMIGNLTREMAYETVGFRLGKWSNTGTDVWWNLKDMERLPF